MLSMESLLSANPLVPVVVINDVADAPGAFAALKAGGITCAEITFRTDCAAEAIKICAQTEGITAGAGTVINVMQAKAAIAAGAEFLVSPGFSKKIAKLARKAGVPYLPGCVNGTQVMAALECGLTTIKFFPAVASGGLPMLKALVGPFPQVKFVPTGGINAQNLAEWISQPFISSVGGSWMITSQMIKEHRWNEITELSQQALQIATEACK